MKFSYFGVYARGEAIRMTLAHAKAPYEDDRINFEQWPSRKSTFLTGQVPVLTVDGKQMNESLAILRFVGKQFGYYPTDSMAAWYVDATVDYVAGQLNKLYPIVLYKKFNEEGVQEYTSTIQSTVSHLDKQLISHGKDYICGEKITIADFSVSALVFSHINNPHYGGGASFTDKGKEIVAEHAKFSQYVDRLGGELKEHLDSRPPAPF